MVARGEFDQMSKQGLPLIPSHEPTGVVVKLGEKAEEMSSSAAGFKEGVVKVGDRIGATAFGNFCNECDECKAGGWRQRYCPDQVFFGVTANGAFSQYCVVDVRSSVRLPESLSFDAAAPLMCAGATIFQGIKECKLEKGQSLAIFGGGALGHLGCQFAKCLGLKTILIDSRKPPLDMCKSLPYPPDILYNSSSVDFDKSDSITKAVESCGGNTDAVIIATDALPAYRLGFEVVKKHGLFMVIGQPKDPIPVSFFSLIFKNVTVKGSLLSDSANLKEMVDLVAEKNIECRTKAYKLTEIDKLIADYALPGHSGKMVVHVGDH